MLSVDDLHVHYGTTHAVRGISLDLDAGEAVALLGANGAGKTSTLRALSRLTASRGRVVFDGQDLAGLTPEAVARRGLIHVPEGRHVFPTLTVNENLQLGATARGARRGGLSLDEVFDLFPALHGLRKRLGYALSGGEQQMVALGRALVAAPRVLMVDEPSLGLAPVVVESVEVALRAIRTHTALLMVEQNVELALRVCSRASIVKQGEIVLQVDAGDVHEREVFLQSYLGREQVPRNRPPAVNGSGRPPASPSASGAGSAPGKQVPETGA